MLTRKETLAVGVGKLGTFPGVYMPTVFTIFGVIMYL